MQMNRSAMLQFGLPALEGSVFVILFKRMLIVCLLFSVVAGCVASSTGGGSAQINTQTAYEIALSPFYLANRSAIDSDHAWHMTLLVSHRKPIAGFLKPNQMLMETFTRMIYSLAPAPGKVLNITEENLVPADCEGGYSEQLQMSKNGQFTGQMSFSAFADDCSLVLDGSVPFEGKLDLTSGEVTSTLSFSSLDATLDEMALPMKGDLRLKFNAFKGEKQASTGVSSLVLADATGVRLSLKNMKFAWDHSEEYQKIEVNGWIDVAGYGSVRLATTSPVRISNTPGRLVTAYKPDGSPAQTTHKRRLPFDGALKFYGDDDGWVRLLFSKPTDPGFFWIDTSKGSQSIGSL